MEEVTVADQSAGEVDVLSSALGDLGFEPEPAKAPKSEASEDDSDLLQDEEDKPETEDPAEDVSEAKKPRKNRTRKPKMSRGRKSSDASTSSPPPGSPPRRKPPL
jgi:hypothetical protein